MPRPETMPLDGRPRCAWAQASAIEREYHDLEWGVPLHEDRALFEFLVLEGAQAGLSWRTVLGKRARYREVLWNFDIERCASLTDADLEELLGDSGLIRNRLKIRSIRGNARAALRATLEFGSLDAFLWRFVDGLPVRVPRRTPADVPSASAQSERMSRELNQRGFRFVGNTICYAFMQATGMVDDHLADCFRAHDPERNAIDARHRS